MKTTIIMTISRFVYFSFILDPLRRESATCIGQLFFRDSFLAILAHLANMLLVLIHTINKQLCSFNGRLPSMKMYFYYLQFSLT